MGLYSVPGSALDRTAWEDPPPLVRQSLRLIGFPGRAWEPESLQNTGAVAAWKSEEVGFEVAGRVASVLEPSVDIDGRTSDENGNVISAVP